MHLSARYILPQLLRMCQVEMPDTSSGGQQSSGGSRGSSGNSGAVAVGPGAVAAVVMTLATAAAKAAAVRAAGSRDGTSSGNSSGRNSSSICSTQARKEEEPSTHKAVHHILSYICDLNASPVACTQYLVCRLVEKRTVLPLWTPTRDAHDGAADKSNSDVAANSAAATASQDAAAAWSADAAQLCGSTENYVRQQALLAAMPSGGSLARGDCGLAFLCSRFLQNNVKPPRWLDGGLLQAALTAGPGSAEQTQLSGLLCSLLKFANLLPSRHEGRLTNAVLAAALAAASILQGTNGKDYILLSLTYAAQQQQQQQRQHPDATEASSLRGQPTCEPPVRGSPQLSRPPATPSLVGAAVWHGTAAGPARRSIGSYQSQCARP